MRVYIYKFSAHCNGLWEENRRGDAASPQFGVHGVRYLCPISDFIFRFVYVYAICMLVVLCCAFVRVTTICLELQQKVAQICVCMVL